MTRRGPGSLDSYNSRPGAWTASMPGPSSSSSTPMSRLAAGPVHATVSNPGSGSVAVGATGPAEPSVHDQVMIAASSMASAHPALPARRRARRAGDRPRGPGARPPVRPEVPRPRRPPSSRSLPLSAARSFRAVLFVDLALASSATSCSCTSWGAWNGVIVTRVDDSAAAGRRWRLWPGARPRGLCSGRRPHQGSPLGGSQGFWWPFTGCSVASPFGRLVVSSTVLGIQPSGRCDAVAGTLAVVDAHRHFLRRRAQSYPYLLVEQVVPVVPVERVRCACFRWAPRGIEVLVLQDWEAARVERRPPTEPTVAPADVARRAGPPCVGIHLHVEPHDCPPAPSPAVAQACGHRPIAFDEGHSRPLCVSLHTCRQLGRRPPSCLPYPVLELHLAGKIRGSRRPSPSTGWESAPWSAGRSRPPTCSSP